MTVHLGLPGPGELRTTCEAARRFGGGLPGWQAGSLRREYHRWQRSRTGR